MRFPSTGRRRWPAAFAACTVALLAHALTPVAVERPASAAAARLTAGGLDDDGYLAVADRPPAPPRAAVDDRRRPLRAGPGLDRHRRSTPTCCSCTPSPRCAATTAPTRADARARAIARFLVGPRGLDGAAARPAPTRRSPARAGSPRPGRTNRHLVLRHRRSSTGSCTPTSPATCSASTRARRRADPRPRSIGVATSRDYRWPALRLNQFNWYAAMFAADAIVNGAHDGARRRAWAATSSASLRARRRHPRQPATSAPACAFTTCRTSAREPR